METCSKESLLYSVNGHTVVLDLRPWPTRHAKTLALAAAAVIAGVLLALPSPALAGGFFDDILGNLFKPITNGVWNFAFEIINWISPHDLATAEFNHIMGSDALKNMAEAICNNAVKPVAAAILSLVMLLQLLKIFQRADANQTIPLLREIVMLFVTCCVAMFLVNNAFPLCSDLYDMVKQFSDGIREQGFSATQIKMVWGDDLFNDLATMASLILVGVIVCLLGLIAAVVCNIMFIVRGIQVYLYAAFSPLMMSLFGLESTRQWAMGFLKSYLAVCMSGVIMYFSISAFPSVVASLTNTAGMDFMADGTPVINAISGTSLGWIVGVCASCLGLILLMIGSGKYAREILGG